MVDKVRLELHLTPEQAEILKNRTQKMGGISRSDYIRYIIFLDTDISDKIDLIYKLLIEDE
ncbi:MAG: hypothetical protein ACE5FT_07010 [Candidatus Nanoarchaeia archaeon]